MPRTALAIVPVLLLLGAALPAPAAAVSGTFELVPMYLHSRSTPHLGAAPLESSPQWTPSMANGLDISSHELHANVRLGLDDTFEVRLPQRYGGPGNYTTYARIEAIGLLGERILLAERAVNTSRTHVVVEQREPSIQDPTDPLGNFVGAVYDEVGEAAEEPVPDVARLAYERACSPNNIACPFVAGDPGIGALRTCRSVNPGVPTLVHQVGSTIDAAARDATGRGICDPASDDVNATWATVAAQLPGGLPPPPVEPPTDLPLPPSAPVPVVYDDNVAWTNFTLEMNESVLLPIVDGAALLPSGYRLQLTVSVRVTHVGNLGSGGSPGVILYGSATAPASLVVRTDTPNAFGILSGGSLLGPGIHFSTVGPTGQREYQFAVPEGVGINVSRPQGPATLRVWEANGTSLFLGGNPPSVHLAPGVARIIHLRVVGSTATDNDFAISIQPLQAFPPEPMLEEGETRVRTLGPGHSTYTTHVDVWQAQKFSVTLVEPEGASYRLRVGDWSAGTWDVSTTEVGRTTTVAGRAARTGYLPIYIERDHGEGPFTLSVDLDEQGDLTFVPVITPFWSAPMGQSFELRLADWDGAYIERFVDGEERILHVSLGGWTTDIAPGGDFLARTHEGALVSAVHGDVVWDVVDERVRLGSAAKSASFGADGALYLGRTPLAGPAEIVRLAPDRTETRIPSSWGARDLRMTPEGRLIGSNETAAVEIDPLSGAHVLLPPAMWGARAFDAEGGAYRILNESLVERVDRATGETHIVARSESNIIADVGIGGNTLFLALDQTGPSLPAGLAAIPLSRTGFSGFTPSFVPGPPADLEVAISDEVVGVRTTTQGFPISEVHEVRVVASNVGSAPAYRFEVHTLRTTNSGNGNTSWFAHVDELAPSDSVMFTYRWETATGSATRVGDQRFSTQVDASYMVAEADELDNVATTVAAAWIGGNAELCQDLDEAILPTVAALDCAFGVT